MLKSTKINNKEERIKKKKAIDLVEHKNNVVLESCIKKNFLLKVSCILINLNYVYGYNYS